MSAQSNRKVNKPFLIGVAGGTASGKSTVCNKIMAKLGQDCQRRVAFIKQDSFYRELDVKEQEAAKIGRFNFDHPDAINEQAMCQALRDILAGVPVKLPIHDYVEYKAKPGEFNEIHSADVVLFEGTLIFYFPNVRDMFNMKLFVDTDSDTRLSRRVMRDVQGRGRDLDMVLDQYDQYVKPAFEEFCQPTKKYADMIIPRGAENEVAIGLINYNVTYLLTTLKNRLYRSKPFSANQSSNTTTSCSLNQVNNIENMTTAQLLSCNSYTQPTSTIRNRSNSCMSATATLAAGQRLKAGFQEELDTSIIN